MVQFYREYNFEGTITKQPVSQLRLPTVATFCSLAEFASTVLSDLLKQETGKTAMDLIQIFLVSEAKNLLNQGDHTVAEIAYLLGFENPAYFSRLFKKETGISPN